MTRFQLTTLGSTAHRRSRKNNPLDRLLSYESLARQILFNIACSIDFLIFSLVLLKVKDGTLKLSICDFRPMILTFLFAQLMISESVMSFPRVRDLRLLRSWSIWVLINCHKKPETCIYSSTVIQFHVYTSYKNKHIVDS